MRGQNMKLAIGLEVIYEDAEFQLGDRDKVGIVGVNGAGKTTLFRLLLKELELDSGQISIGNARVGYLPQEIIIEDENETVWEYLLDGRPVRKLERELQEIYKVLETETDEEKQEVFACLTWYGEYCLEESEVVSETQFPLSAEGREQVIDWLEEQWYAMKALEPKEEED